MSGFSELAEAEAEGEIAQIYAEIRHFYGVPYVSSLQRHLATLPGVLEWAWGAVRPAFASGALPESAWEAARIADLPPLPRLSPAALRLLGVDDGDVARIRNVCRSFEKVAPLNMAMGATLRALLNGEKARGGTQAQGLWQPPEAWQPPEVLPPAPTTLHPDEVDPDTRAVLMQLAAGIDKEQFVPGLYRQLANWPGYLAHAATQIAPLIGAAQVEAKADRLRATIAQGASRLLENLPEPPPAPLGAPVAHILASIEAYQITSPQMIFFGKLLREALPE